MNVDLSKYCMEPCGPVGFVGGVSKFFKSMLEGRRLLLEVCIVFKKYEGFLWFTVEGEWALKK